MSARSAPAPCRARRLRARRHPADGHRRGAGAWLPRSGLLPRRPMRWTSRRPRGGAEARRRRPARQIARRGGHRGHRARDREHGAGDHGHHRQPGHRPDGGGLRRRRRRGRASTASPSRAGSAAGACWCRRPGAALAAAGRPDLRSHLALPRDVLRRSDRFRPRRRQRVLAGLEERCRAFAEEAGAGADFGIDWSTEARYPDQAWEIEVPLRSSRFELERDVADLRRRLPPHASGDLRRQRPDLADRDGRLECRGPLPDRQRRARPAADGGSAGEAAAARRGPFRRAGWRRGDGPPLRGDPGGAEIAGPAIVESSFTSIVIDPGAIATRDASAPSSSTSERGRHGERRSNIDGIRMAVLTARFNGIARKMANTLLRTGRSGILTIAHDFSCAVLTAEHELLADGREPADPRAARPGDHDADDDRQSSGPEARRRLPAQFALSWLHASGRSLDPGPGHRRRRRPPLHRARPRATRPIAAMRCRPPTWARPRTSTPRAR